MATRLLPDPVGVDRMTLAPEPISLSGSSWCSYSRSPCCAAQPANASNTASGPPSPMGRSASVTAELQVVDAAARGEGAPLVQGDRPPFRARSEVTVHSGQFWI